VKYVSTGVRYISVAHGPRKPRASC
jgi:hypothetical protein